MTPDTRPRDPQTGRFLPTAGDGDARWEQIFADRSRDDALATLVARIEADRAAGRTLSLGWDEIDEAPGETGGA